jgi:hemoglobin
MYDRVGGDAFFEDLTTRFYAAVANEPLLRPLYPQDPANFEAARRRLMLFLVQHWGGPSRYRAQRGDGNLQRRHARFPIGTAERDAWLRHMTAAVRAGGLRPLDETQMLSFFRATANHLVNRTESQSGPEDQEDAG